MESECFDCTAGWACVGLALLEPNVLCQAGYYCQGKALTPAPLDGVTGDKCSEGFYCPEGTGQSKQIALLSAKETYWRCLDQN